MRYQKTYAREERPSVRVLYPQDTIRVMERAIIRWGLEHTTVEHPKTLQAFCTGIGARLWAGGLGAFLDAWGNCLRNGMLVHRDVRGNNDRHTIKTPEEADG
jgi:hypothetical protein